MLIPSLDDLLNVLPVWALLSLQLRTGKERVGLSLTEEVVKAFLSLGEVGGDVFVKKRFDELLQRGYIPTSLYVE